MSLEARKIYGQGIRTPLQQRAGRLVSSAGFDRVWEAIEAVLETPQGTCALDPAFGTPLVAFDPMSSPEQAAWAIANAITYAEPRITELDVHVVNFDLANGTLYLEIVPTVANAIQLTSRVFPFYRQVQ